MTGSPAFLVFAATSGIGTALARRLASGGATLTITGRDGDRIAALARDVGAAYAVVDATDFDAVDRCVREAAERTGRLDGVINCAGSLLLKPAHLTKADEFAATIAASLTTAFAVTRAAARTLGELGGGSIALVSSAAARSGLANHEAIAAAKAGVIGLTLSAAATYAARNVRVNCVAPGLVRTPLTKRITGSPSAEQASIAMHALARLGEPDDVASALAWLVAPENAWVTGQVLGVDGGLGTVRAR
ncbi:MAG: SDR family oxidoreductase [Gemmatimonadaceae bacterium]|nr:SDR family oxidoreductase [Gemmatimonadaceae bacterium]